MTRESVENCTLQALTSEKFAVAPYEFSAVVVAEIEEQELSLDPVANDELSTIVNSSIAQLDGGLSAALDAHHGVKFAGSGSIVRPATWKELGESVVELDHGGVGDHDVLEGVEAIAEVLECELELRQGMFDRPFEERNQAVVEAAIERRWHECRSSGSLVGSPKTRDLSSASNAEAKHQGPEERHGLHFALALDELGCPRKSIEPLIRKETLESLTNSGRLTVRHDPSTLSFCQITRESVADHVLLVHRDFCLFSK